MSKFTRTVSIVTRTSSQIGQRTAYPKMMRVAATNAHKTMTTATVARDWNISTSTVCRWSKAAGQAKQQPQQLARHQAAKAALQAYNTPIVVKDANGAITGIQYRGRLYI